MPLGLRVRVSPLLPKSPEKDNMIFDITLIVTLSLAGLWVVVAIAYHRSKRKTRRMLEEYVAAAKIRDDLFNTAEMAELMELNEETNPLLAETWRDTLSISDETHEELLKRSLEKHADIWKKMAGTDQ